MAFGHMLHENIIVDSIELGESDLYAALKASAEGLGAMSVLSDLGWYVKGEVWGDAGATLGIINRRGLGKTRHIDTGHLWIQEVAAKGRLKFEKVLGRDNPADLYTKYLDEKTNILILFSKTGRHRIIVQTKGMSNFRFGWNT